MHACACADNGREKRNVLIVSILLPIAVNFALRSNTQRRIDVLGMRLQTLLLHVATAPKTVVGHGQVEDQALAARRVLEVDTTLPRRKIGQKKSPAFPNPWLAESSEGAQRRAWKLSGLCRDLNTTLPTCENLV